MNRRESLKAFGLTAVSSGVLLGACKTKQVQTTSVNPTNAPVGSESINIKSLGVVGNGTDEHSAFQNALNAADGKELLIENMTIRTHAFSVPGNNMRIRMHNSVIKYIASGSQPDIFCYVTGKGKEFYGMVFDMEGLAGNETSGTTVMYFDNCEDVLVVRCQIHDNGHAAIKIVGGRDVTITRNHIWNTDSAIFCLSNDTVGGVQNLMVDHNTIHGGTSEGIGVFSHAAENLISHTAQITNNHIYNKPSAGFNFSRTVDLLCANNIVNDCYAGAFLEDSGSGLAHNEFATNIQISNNKFVDLEVGLNNVGDDCQVQLNTFKNIGRSAIYTNGHVNESGVENVLAYGTFITDNHFVNCSHKDNAYPAVDLNHLRNLVMRGNTFMKAPNTNCKAIRFVDCTGVIERNFAPDSQLEHAAKDTTSYGNRLTFSDNTFFDVTQVPVYPITGDVWNWRYFDNRYINLEADPFSHWYDLTATNEKISGIHERYVRPVYRVAADNTVSFIVSSWLHRQITLISKGGMVIKRGGNLALAEPSYTLAAGDSIDLRWDGTYWRQLYHSVASPT